MNISKSLSNTMYAQHLLTISQYIDDVLRSAKRENKSIEELLILHQQTYIERYKLLIKDLSLEM